MPINERTRSVIVCICALADVIVTHTHVAQDSACCANTNLDRLDRIFDLEEATLWTECGDAAIVGGAADIRIGADSAE